VSPRIAPSAALERDLAFLPPFFPSHMYDLTVVMAIASQPATGEERGKIDMKKAIKSCASEPSRRVTDGENPNALPVTETPHPRPFFFRHILFLAKPMRSSSFSVVVRWSSRGAAGEDGACGGRRGRRRASVELGASNADRTWGKEGSLVFSASPSRASAALSKHLPRHVEAKPSQAESSLCRHRFFLPPSPFVRPFVHPIALSYLSLMNTRRSLEAAAAVGAAAVATHRAEEEGPVGTVRKEPYRG